MIKIDKSIVEQVTWEQDPDTFDQRLHALGSSHDEFVIVNPKYEWILDYIDVDAVTSDKCIVWSIDNLWLIKKFKANWTYGWHFIPCVLDLEQTIEFNPDVNFTDYDVDFKINIEDANAEHVWYLDPDFVPVEDKIWAVRARVNYNNTQGTKDMGYITPKVEYQPTAITFNPNIPVANFVDFEIPSGKINYEYVWYLDPQFNSFEDKIWAARIKPSFENSLGIKDMGYISPVIKQNPEIPADLLLNDVVPYYELQNNLVWYLDPKFNSFEDKIWALRIDSSEPDAGVKNMGYVSPILNIIRNPEIPDVNLVFDTNIPYYNLKDNLVWYLDPKFNPIGENIWAIKILSKEENPGYLEMGYASPEFIFNPDIPKIAWNINDSIPYYELNYTHIWYLDPQFNPNEDDVWLAKIVNPNELGVKHMGHVSPKMEFNPDIPDVAWAITDNIPYYDLNYTHIWYLDKRFNPGDDNVWVAKIVNPDNPNASGVKHMGYIMPQVELNPDIPAHLDYYINDQIPYYDLNYEHVWMLDNSLHTDHEQIWAAKIVPNNVSLGTTVVGNIGVVYKDFDVVFISYNEPNAEANWYRVLEIFPNAKRVKNVKGIFEAHKRAAEIATTDMFYVVDGDAELVDNWKFDYKPNVFDLDCVHLWTSINPINDLEYGWGGVKLFPRKLLLDAETWKVDLTTGLGKLKYINKVSNVTSFNSDEFGTWRSAFRECAKLSSSLYQGTTTHAETEERLRVWTTVGKDRRYGEYALHGAALGKQYGLDNFNNLDALKLINNYEWMKNEFDKFYKH